MTSILSWRTTVSRTSINWSPTRVKCERYQCVHVSRSLWLLTRQSTASTWLVMKKFITVEIDISIVFARQHSTAKSTTPFTTRHKARNIVDTLDEIVESYCFITLLETSRYRTYHWRLQYTHRLISDIVEHWLVIFTINGAAITSSYKHSTFE